MEEQLVLDLGVMPDYVRLKKSALTSPPATNVRWKLELWKCDDGWQLRHHDIAAQINDIREQQLLCSYARPARGPGYCSLQIMPSNTLEQDIIQGGLALLGGRFDDLGWMKSTASRLGKVWNINWAEHDWGIDY